MLVLSRKPGQKIHIGDVTVTVTRCTNGTVRLGIEAPPWVTILRDELRSEFAEAQPAASPRLLKKG
jgi:carbon storage regulator